MNLNPSLRNSLALLLIFGGLGWMSASHAAPLAISETPLFLTTNVPPNVIVTLDDSGSMSRAFTPDVCGNPNAICDDNPDASLNPRYLKSSHYNPIYYNPKVTYKPPVDASGTELTTTFGNAWVNGYAHSLPNISPDSFDLATQYRPTAGLFLSGSTKSHQFMNHYTASADLTKTITYSYATHVDSGTMQGTNTGSNAPYFIINDFVNQDGSGTPGSNLLSVTVNGATASNVGTFSGTCSSSNDPGSSNQYKTKVSGSTLTLCFRDTNSMYGSDVVVAHKVAGTTSETVPVTATDPVGAYYYVFNELNANCSGTAAEKKVDNDCYTVRLVSTTSGADRDGDGSINATEADERQNFANWYSFYRTRNLATIASASLAASEFNASTRLAWQALNSCNTLPTSSCSGWDGVNVSNAIKPFAGTHKQNFYNWLFRLNTNSSTPLRDAMLRAGSYYSTTGENSPYDDDLSASGTVSGSSGQLSCRKNFHILMTDGIWNGGISTTVGDTDGSLAPYADSNSNSLADIAYKYWNTDLVDLPGNDNNLLPRIVEAGTEPGQTNNPKNDPATWQHMVNFTVGLGLTPFLASAAGGSLTYGDADPNTPDTYTGSYSALLAGTKSWPTTGENLDGNVADLWHAALNSRGRFFSADSPGALVRDFKGIVNAIQDQTASAAALAANSTSTQEGAMVYQAVFNGKDWSGDLRALPIGFGGVVGAQQWSAASQIPAAADRKIFTFYGGSKIDFNGAAIGAYLNTNASGDEDTNGPDRLAWLRGDRSKEIYTDPVTKVTTGIFRTRSSVLGDIINADPAFSHAEDFGYADMVADEASSYESYVDDKADLTPAVFVGANDGMLHAFHADSGVELFAFVPNAVYPNLSKLTDPYYTHKYYVDGGPTVGDAYLSGGWSTVLVGGLGGGGKSVYALNVSNMASPSATSMLMWEFTDTDLGLTYSKPQIARLNNGTWVAIFGNGYNSTSERAYLYVVNLETGAQIAKIAAGSATSNGLSTPVVHDANGDKIADYAYAGDLQGNLWKFDLTSFADQTTPQFAARNAGMAQPITAQPAIGGHPSGGVLVYFGTGQYLQSADVADPVTNVPNTNEQTFYGIWDNGAPVLTTDRSQLQQQSIVAATNEFGKTLRETTANTVDWSSKLGWYIDFDQPQGERVVSHALLKYGRVVFVTVVPSTDICDAGGYSWIMDLDAVTGARSTTGSNYDFNNNGAYDASDYLASGAAASGIKTTVGISKTPAWFEGVDTQGNKTGTDYIVWTGSSSGTESIGTKAPVSGGGALRRVYWLQIQ